MAIVRLTSSGSGGLGMSVAVLSVFGASVGFAETYAKCVIVWRRPSSRISKSSGFRSLICLPSLVTTRSTWTRLVVMRTTSCSCPYRLTARHKTSSQAALVYFRALRISSLRLSAYLCVLCVESKFNAEDAEIRREPQRCYHLPDFLVPFRDFLAAFFVAARAFELFFLTGILVGFSCSAKPAT